VDQGVYITLSQIGREEVNDGQQTGVFIGPDAGPGDVRHDAGPEQGLNGLPDAIPNAVRDVVQDALPEALPEAFAAPGPNAVSDTVYDTVHGVSTEAVAWSIGLSAEDQGPLQEM
jgi:hypothetical protein